MSDVNNELKQIKIEEYDLVSFVMKIQQGIRDGYEVNDSSDDAPIQIGGAFHLIMRQKAKCGIDKLSVSLDTTRLQEVVESCLESVNQLNDQIDVRINAAKVAFEKDADKWDNKELGAEESYVETISPPKEPTLDEALPKEEQVVLQTKQTNKRGRK